MSDIPFDKMFEDMSLLTMEEWRKTSAEELEKEYSVTLRDDIEELAYCDVSKSMLAIRYSRRVGGVLMHDVHVFVFEADGDGPGCLERHYRVRATETV